jgi:hypothetical protein
MRSRILALSIGSGFYVKFEYLATVMLEQGTPQGRKMLRPMLLRTS